LTVIAYKDGVMAADTQLTGFNRTNRAQKIMRLPDGGVAGGCGLWTAAYAGLKFLAAGGSEDKDVLPDIKDATILIARPDGSLWLLEDRFPAFPITNNVASVGCGSDAAEMAMSFGLSAVEAVAAVTQQDVLCGDPIQSMAVEPTHEYGQATTYALEKPAQRKRAAKKPAKKRK
jgi:hypothetical protein